MENKIALQKTKYYLVWFCVLFIQHDEIRS